MHQSGTGRRQGGPRPWQEAWQDALYGSSGFYRRPEGPVGHFRTSAHTPVLAGALARLAASYDCGTVVDVGSGRGELLHGLAAADPSLSLVGVDVVARPDGLPAGAEWVRSPGGAGLPDLPSYDGALVVAHEWLDVVPQPVLSVDAAGVPRLGVVDDAGEEAVVDGAWPGRQDDLVWCARWWPLLPDTRVEVGRCRDEAWAALCRSVTRGVVLAVDYDHRRTSRPPQGSLTGYARGRQVPPVPDGSCDLTSHVALDACAAAGEAALAGRGRQVATSLRRQHEWLRDLGVDASVPPSGLAADPVAYLEALGRSGAAREVLDPGGLGGLGWLVHVVG